MAEMPFDVLNHRLGKIRDNGDPDFDNTAAALDIDMELQSKFLFFPDAELSEIAEQVEETRGVLHIGQNVGNLAISAETSVEDAYTLAQNALALFWYVRRTAEMKAEDAKKLAQRPEPGAYRVQTRVTVCTAYVTEERRILFLDTDGRLVDRTEIWDAKPGACGWVFTLLSDLAADL